MGKNCGNIFGIFFAIVLILCVVTIVTRYSEQAQTCYCGTAKCRGTIGTTSDAPVIRRRSSAGGASSKRARLEGSASVANRVHIHDIIKLLIF
jgi:hypothetical protein